MKECKEKLVGGAYPWVRTERGYTLVSPRDLPWVFIDKRSHPEDFIPEIPVIVDSVVDKGNYMFAMVHQAVTTAPAVEVIAEYMLESGYDRVTTYRKGNRSFVVVRKKGCNEVLLIQGATHNCYLPATLPALEKWDKEESSVDDIFLQFPSDQNRLMDSALDSGKVSECSEVRTYFGERILGFDSNYSFLGRNGELHYCHGFTNDWVEKYADGPAQDAATYIVGGYWNGQLTSAEVRRKFLDVCKLPISLEAKLLRTSKQIMAEDELLDDAQKYGLLRVMYEPEAGIKWIAVNAFDFKLNIFRIAACFSSEEVLEILDKCKIIMEEAKKKVANKVKLHRMTII